MKLLQLTLFPTDNTVQFKPRNRLGRKSTVIYEAELKTILQALTNPNQTQREAILANIPAWKIKDSINIYKTDVGKKGAITRYGVCPVHGRTRLGYNWGGYSSGVRVRCFVKGCDMINTHYEPMLHNPEPNPESFHDE
jgi:hypothetical protein